MSKPRVFISRPIPEPGLSMVQEFAQATLWGDELPPPREVLLRELREVQGVLCLLTERMDAEAMEAAPSLRVISNLAVGYDNVDVPAATARRILVCNTPGVLTDTTADLAFALLLATARRIAEADRYTRAGKWKTWGPMILLGQDLHHATLGIIGMGRIGQEVARRAQGFSMRILYTDPVRNERAERELGCEYVELDELLRRSDFVTIHCLLSPETHRLIGARELALMKPTAVLVNTARGPIVDQKALYEALRDGVIWAAGLDVTDPEPISPDDPLLSLDNVIIPPHIGSASYATRSRMAQIAAQNLISALRGERPPHPVNPEVLP